ncbi:aspartate/tyrosine/aromatic aminotransferase [Herbaspirillum lusitanum]|uniref:amino acid aminotransferase n=1 Tax=Herbaspirillum lusitanum TaxID=213312 RepID=UPI00223812C8|nr:amino acid aminotransferase [Herbaspirillum lusitanum]MCW5296781.1 aspartate/tyrosine/aromatic aminotransferase [Herbaspirillum lusitanum]
MNHSTTLSLLSSVAMAPRDPILGVTEAYNQSTHPDKINLGVGVYYDDRGKVPLLDCVRAAEAALQLDPKPHTYLPIDGLAAYNKAVGALLFDGCTALAEQRVVTLQTAGGTGALKVGADFFRRFFPEAQVWISNPSWENHAALFESAGFVVNHYPYYDAAGNGIDFAAMLEALEHVPTGNIVLLHACCHNPTGLDLDEGRWEQVLGVIARRGLIPFLDMAYQGFGAGLAADGKVVRRFADGGLTVFVSSTFSKSFSLYGERIGALSVVAADADAAARLQSQLKRTIRTNYSSPPEHGARLVATVLGSAPLRAMWEQELAAMRERIRTTRRDLRLRLEALAPGRDFSFLTRQSGLFSYTGLDKEQVRRLREEYAIYTLDTGRICVAAVNSGNIERVAQAIATVSA